MCKVTTSDEFAWPATCYRYLHNIGWKETWDIFPKNWKKLLDNKNISVPGFSEIASKIYLNSGQKLLVTGY